MVVEPRTPRPQVGGLCSIIQESKVFLGGSSFGDAVVGPTVEGRTGNICRVILAVVCHQRWFVGVVDMNRRCHKRALSIRPTLVWPSACLPRRENPRSQDATQLCKKPTSQHECYCNWDQGCFHKRTPTRLGSLYSALVGKSVTTVTNLLKRRQTF